jgi:4-hydroxy-tetrahydrodipicolinate synthase
VDESKGKFPYSGNRRGDHKGSRAVNQRSRAVGCDAVSVIVPYFLTPNGEELYEHYKAIADSVNIPVLLYNNPDRSIIRSRSPL